MPREMFGDVINPSVKTGSKSGYTVTLTMVIQLLVIALLAIVSLKASVALPEVSESLKYALTSVKLPPPPPPPRVQRNETNQPDGPSRPDLPPLETPREIKDETPGNFRDFEYDKPVGDVPGGGFPDITPPAPPPVPEVPKELLRVGGNVKPPQKVRHVNPLYPPIAQSARVQGVVIIEATIGPTGEVLNTRVLRSIPLLDEAALDAVKGWQFTPTLLNGVPVPVVMTVTVQFSLQ